MVFKVAACELPWWSLVEDIFDKVFDGGEDIFEFFDVGKDIYQKVVDDSKDLFEEFFNDAEDNFEKVLIMMKISDMMT